MSNAPPRTTQSASTPYQALLALARSDVLATGDLPRAAALITRMAAQTLGVARASIWLFEGQPRELVCIDAYEPAQDHHLSGWRFPEHLCPRYCRFLEDHRLLAISDAVHDGTTAEFAEIYLKAEGIGAVLDAPIYRDGVACGVVCNAHKGGIREWTDEEQHFAAALADMVALVLATSRRLAAEQALRATEERYRLAVQASRVGVWDWSATADVLHADQQFWALAGTAQRPDQALLPALDGVLPAPELMEFMTLLRALAGGRAPDFSLEHRFLRPGQPEPVPADAPWMLTRGRPIRSAEGAIIGVMGTTIDITERRAAEEAERHAREEAELAAATKNRYLANMGHELRTPLNGILGISYLLLDSGLKGEPQQFAQIIHDCASVLVDTFSNLLDMAKLDANSINKELAPVDCAKIARSAIAVVTPRARLKNLPLQVAVEVPAGLVPVTDEGRLTQVLVILLDNAVKFTDQGAVELTMVLRLVPETGEDGERRGMLEAHIRDSGPGISPQIRERLFTPFSAHDDSPERRRQGSGLGLAIAKGMTELLGGRIEVASEPGVGTTMSVLCPVRVVPALPAVAAGDGV